MNLRKEKNSNDFLNILIYQDFENYLDKPEKIFEEKWIKKMPIEKDHLVIMFLQCEKQQITAALSDGRLISISTNQFSRLSNATEEQLNNFEISPSGYAIHWFELDEDISIKAFIKKWIK